jgi:hypothetical protein
VIPIGDVEELYNSILNGATSVAETRFSDAGSEYEMAFEALYGIGQLETGTAVRASGPTLRWGWAEFEASLATVLASLVEDQYLIVQVKHRPYFVQFAAQGAEGMRVESTSNVVVSPAFRLDQSQVDELVRLGWQRPTGTVDSSTPERDTAGSPNFFIDV